jgi:hypothetical protein
MIYKTTGQNIICFMERTFSIDVLQLGSDTKFYPDEKQVG